MKGRRNSRWYKPTKSKYYLEKNPYAGYKPGLFIPIYSVDKTKIAKEEGHFTLETLPNVNLASWSFLPSRYYAEQIREVPFKEKEDKHHLDVANHIDKNGYFEKKSRKEHSALPCSECTFKVLNKNRAHERILAKTLLELSTSRQKVQCANETLQMQLHKQFMQTKQKTRPLHQLQISACRIDELPLKDHNLSWTHSIDRENKRVVKTSRITPTYRHAEIKSHQKFRGKALSV